MARPLRIELEGGVFHVTSRGNAGAAIFEDDADRTMFMDVLVHVVERFRWICHAWCLMGNHYHLMIETPQANLSRGMRQLNGVYTQQFNRRHKRTGHVYQGRFSSILVDRESYLLALSRYVVRNPVAAGLAASVEAWPWSSFRATAGLAPLQPPLSRQWLLSCFGTSTTEAEAAYIDYVCDGKTPSPWDDLNGPDILGDDDFRARVQAGLHDVAGGIARSKRMLRHLSLAEISAEKPRSLWMHEAYTEHGYTMQQIALFAGVHHSTVSKCIKQAMENSKSRPDPGQGGSGCEAD
ncbi:transposase [Mariprofundus erugo]|uniref:Transposase n=1 Tax=Mariprofundus erugo TaxID=2528639 RepID=A0A5R9GK41_9PROT|nr:transposase [Mariprofundus erugo]TLS66560.1 transposase [Mariprofundus erugo]TLS77810.1 transposase [Mariprofundus erugo]